MKIFKDYLTRARGEEGVTLVELVVAMALGGVLIAIVVSLMVSSMDNNVNSDANNEGWLEATDAGVNLTLLLKNIARIEPGEDYETAHDKLYVGIAPLNADNAPAVCDLSHNNSAIRLTSIALKQSSERLLRKWISSSAGSDTAADELRLSFDPHKSAFAKANPPTELFLVDQDEGQNGGGKKRRFAVRSFENRTTEKHPYDDLPRFKPDGTKMLFQYTAVILDHPLSPKGTPVSAPVPAVSFITESMALPSRTVVVCVAKDPKAQGLTKDVPTLTEIFGGERRVLINLGNSGRLRFRRFQVFFTGTRTSGRFDELPFWTDPLTETKLQCLDVAKFSLELWINGARVAEGAAGERKVELARSVLLPNFTARRPIVCN